MTGISKAQEGYFMQTAQKQHHIMPYKTILTILGILFVLTGITIGASMIDLGKLNVWVALIIASIKCSLVVLFFMHLKDENRVIKISFVVTLFTVAILIGFIFWDIAFR
jgi:cytochrome c oxidase subunit 4